MKFFDMAGDKYNVKWIYILNNIFLIKIPENKITSSNDSLN